MLLGKAFCPSMNSQSLSEVGTLALWTEAATGASGPCMGHQVEAGLGPAGVTSGLLRVE